MNETLTHLTGETLFARLDGRLEPAQAAAAEAHLAACAACAEQAESFRRLFSDLAAVPDLEAPAGLAAPVLAAIRARSAETTLRLPSAIRIAAALQLAAAVGIFLLLGPQIVGMIETGPGLPDPVGWLDSLVQWFARLPGLAASWTLPVRAWLEQLQPPAFSSFHFDADALLPSIAALLPLIASSGLLWLVGNALLIRSPRKTQENAR